MVFESGELPTFLRARAYCLLSKVDLVERRKNLLEAYVDGVRTRDHAWKAKTTSRVNCRVRLSSLGTNGLVNGGKTRRGVSQRDQLNSLTRY